MEDISCKFREWLLEKDKWGIYKRRAEMCPDTLEVGFYHGYTIAQKELQEKLDAAIEVIKFYAEEMNYSVDDYHGISGEMRKRCVLYKDCEERNDVYSYAGMRARDFLKARGE